MSLVHSPYHVGLALLLVTLSVLSVTLVTSMRPVSAAPTGTYFDHIVIIAMENTAYASVLGSGTVSSCPTSSAPFLCGMLPLGSTLPNYNSYGATAADTNDFNGCSAACYVGFMLGYTYGISDGYSFSSVSGNPQLVTSLSSAGLTWQAYCESGCPRGDDHFPFSGANTFTSSSVSTGSFVTAANSATPPNFLWFTPTDSHNMHDVSVSTGDSYLQSFLVGSGSMASPASGSLLASNVFTNPSYRTLLYLWWDECGGSNGSCDVNNASPNLLYGTPVKKGYVSSDLTGIDEYAALRTIENNWGFSPLAQGDTAAANGGYMFNDIFGSGNPLPLSTSFTFSPSNPAIGVTTAFTGTSAGGTLPYSYSWNFGDGSSGSGAITSHSYSSAGQYSVTVTVTDSSSKTATSSQSVTVSQPNALTAGFTYAPSVPFSGQSVTFTGTASGGTSPYSYSWNLAGTSKTGNTVSQSFTNGTYTISVTVTDATGKTATSSQSLTILPASTGSGSVPTLVGWGAVRMDESQAGSGGTSSAVFPGESASNMELLLIEMKAKGYNTVRVDFDPYCTDTVDYNYMSVYSQTNAQRAVQIAQHYGFWIIIDYHGYSDIFRNTSCWLNSWKPIAQNIGPMYSQIVWEPENEPTTDCSNSPSSCPSAPCSSDSSCVTYLGNAYQRWINQTRSLGDNHWIVAQNLCSYACGFSDMSLGYPIVTDPLGTLAQGGRIFISLHSYMDYNQFSGSWTNTTAETVANHYYQAVVAGVSNTGWPALNTEGGTDTLSCDPNMCGPDIVLNGSAGYTLVTFHFIQSLVSLYDGNSLQRINWVWWPAGSWTNTPGAGTYGAMNCASNPEGWGCLLQFANPSQPDPYFTISASSESGLSTGQSADSTITITGQNGFDGTVTLTDTVPSGLTCYTITPSNLTGSGIATVSCSSSIASIYTLTITGANGSLVHSTTATFNFKQQDFTITATSPSGVYTTRSATTTISVSSVNGFNGNVALADTVPAGLDCGALTTTDLAGSGSVTVSCNSPTAGTYTLNVTGTSGPLTHSASAVFRFKDFILITSLPPLGEVGTSTNSTITIVGLNGFSGTVLLVDTVPKGLTCGPITPSSITANGNATLSCNSTAQSVYSVTIQATSGSLSHLTNVSLTFGTPPDFAVSSIQPLRVETGSNITSTITVSLIHGFNGTVVLTEAVPSDLNCEPIFPATITGNSTATISCHPTAASTYPVTIIGRSGSLVHTSTFVITAVDFYLSASPTSISVNINATGASTITVGALNGFGGNVTIDSSNPTGLMTTLSSNSVIGSGSLSLGVSSAAVGTYTVVISGTSGSLRRTATLTVHVGKHVPPVLAVPSGKTVSQLATISFLVNATDQSIPSPTLTLSAANLPKGASFATIQGAIPVSGIFSWTPSPTTIPETYTITFTVTDGFSSTDADLMITVVATNVLPVIIAPGPRNATVGATLEFTVTASDPSGFGGTVTLSATGLASNMAFDAPMGSFSFTPSRSQSGETFMINFTATDSSNPSWTSTRTVMIQVENAGNTPSSTPSTQPPPKVSGSSCLICTLETAILAVAWFIFIGAAIGVVSSVAFLTLRARAKLLNMPMRLRSRLLMKTFRGANNPVRSRIDGKKDPSTGRKETPSMTKTTITTV